MSNDIVIVSAKRTPLGGFQGELASMQAAELGAVAIEAAVETANLSKDCLLYTSPSPRDATLSRMPSSA